MNNDLIEPGGGFATHPHDNAEIFTYVMSGRLEHKDSMGNGSVIKAGDLQYMSAGSGCTIASSTHRPMKRPSFIKFGWNQANREASHDYAEKNWGKEPFPTN